MSGGPVSAVGTRFFPVTQRVVRRAASTGALHGTTVAVADPVLAAALADALERLDAHIDGEAIGGPLADLDEVRSAIAGSASIAAAEASAWTEVMLRHFARRTNLLLASTETLVVGAGSVAARLQSALVLIGARSTRIDGFPADGIGHGTAVVFATGEGHEAVAPASVIPDAPHPLILVDAARTGSAVDRTAFATGEPVPAREGIDGFRHGREVFLLDQPDRADRTLVNTTTDLTTAFALAALVAWASQPSSPSPDPAASDTTSAFAEAERVLAEELAR
ncbi:hypothetical protein ACL9RL_00555 [Plantibacter sp. Mn2098]|uniref:hypothetical protein n=1 Tax=Plantibacter sp. Mn2098 TaxID=3395266 RepID=UPI003BCEFE2B